MFVDDNKMLPMIYNAINNVILRSPLLAHVILNLIKICTSEFVIWILLCLIFMLWHTYKTITKNIYNKKCAYGQGSAWGYTIFFLMHNLILYALYINKNAIFNHKSVFSSKKSNMNFRISFILKKYRHLYLSRTNMIFWLIKNFRFWLFSYFFLTIYFWHISLILVVLNTYIKTNKT